MNQNRTRIQLPGIGMRIVKSALAIFICYIVNWLRGGQGIVFYSQLAALWCVQMYRSNTIKNAVQRTIGTTVGALYGLLYLLIYPVWCQSGSRELLEAGIISVMIIFVLYTTVLVNQKQSSYFSCVVFLSIVVNHVADANPYIFVWNRFLDTIIGIMVGIAINDIRPCLHPDRETLFISGIDNVLLDQKEMLSAFSKVELNRMIDNGLRFTLSTVRTPASLIEPLRDLRLKLPVIAMDGAVLYDFARKSYLKVYVISSRTAQSLMKLILEAGINWYVNVIIQDMLVIYYGDTEDAVNVDMVEELRTSPFRNYVKRPMPTDEDIVYFMLLDEENKIEEFYHILEENGFTKELKILKYPSQDYPSYAYIKIYNRNASKENMIAYLKQMLQTEKVVTFGTIPGQYDVLIHGKNVNELVRKVRAQYEPILRKTDMSKM